MLDFVIPILGCWLDNLWSLCVPIFCLAFLATVPCVIRQLLGK